MHIKLKHSQNKKRRNNYNRENSHHESSYHYSLCPHGICSINGKKYIPITSSPSTMYNHHNCPIAPKIPTSDYYHYHTHTTGSYNCNSHPTCGGYSSPNSSPNENNTIINLSDNDDDENSNIEISSSSNHGLSRSNSKLFSPLSCIDHENERQNHSTSTNNLLLELENNNVVDSFVHNNDNNNNNHSNQSSPYLNSSTSSLSSNNTTPTQNTTQTKNNNVSQSGGETEDYSSSSSSLSCGSIFYSFFSDCSDYIFSIQSIKIGNWSQFQLPDQIDISLHVDHLQKKLCYYIEDCSLPMNSLALSTSLKLEIHMDSIHSFFLEYNQDKSLSLILSLRVPPNFYSCLIPRGQIFDVNNIEWETVNDFTSLNATNYRFHVIRLLPSNSTENYSSKLKFFLQNQFVRFNHESAVEFNDSTVLQMKNQFEKYEKLVLQQRFPVKNQPFDGNQPLFLVNSSAKRTNKKLQISSKTKRTSSKTTTNARSTNPPLPLTTPRTSTPPSVNNLHITNLTPQNISSTSSTIQNNSSSPPSSSSFNNNNDYCDSNINHFCTTTPNNFQPRIDDLFQNFTDDSFDCDFDILLDGDRILAM